ncbi:MAG: VOC family protein [Acinetobacter tjernbergiae]
MSSMLKKLNHIGLTVHNIKDTLDFYKKITTVEIYEEAVHIGGDGVANVIKVTDPDYYSCMARIGGCSFELIEHHTSKGQHLVANHNDVCGIHLAFMVNNIEEIFEQVKKLGIKPTTDAPYTASELDDYKTFFFRDLNGVQVEIGQVNMIDGM